MQSAPLISESPLSEVEVTRWRNGVVSHATDKVAEEVPIALIYNGVSHAVMLATPQDCEDFALGFSLSEGILQNKSELYDIEIVAQDSGIELKMDVASEAFATRCARDPSPWRVTSCGLSQI